MTRNLKLISLTTASLLLIILTSSCATTRINEEGWRDTGDGYAVTYEAGREAAETKAENKLLKKEVSDDTLWQSITHNVTVFTIGVGVGLVTGVIILP